jgi:hypothetical protein
MLQTIPEENLYINYCKGIIPDNEIIYNIDGIWSVDPPVLEDLLIKYHRYCIGGSIGNLVAADDGISNTIKASSQSYTQISCRNCSLH